MANANRPEFFNDTVTGIIFSQENAHHLPYRTPFPGTTPPARALFTKVLGLKINNRTSEQSPLSRTINSCVDLLESMQAPSHSLPANHRQIYTRILCASTISMLTMRAATEHLSARVQMAIESPLKGALTVASVLGHVPLIEALIARGSRVDDQSEFFESAVEAAAIHQNIDAVKVLLKYSKPNRDDIFGAIKGGDRDIVKLFLEECYPGTWSTVMQLSKSSAYSGAYSDAYYENSRRKSMVNCAAYNDQTALIYMLTEYFPLEHRPDILRGALYSAVSGSAISTINSLLDAGVNISKVIEGAANALHIAANRGDLKIAKLLLEHGFEDLDGCYGDSMHIAVVKGHTDMVQLLLDYGADVNCRFGNPMVVLNDEFWEEVDWDGCTTPAATNAARAGDFHTFCFVVRRGARVDVNGQFGSLQQQWLERIREWEAQSSVAE